METVVGLLAAALSSAAALWQISRHVSSPLNRLAQDMIPITKMEFGILSLPLVLSDIKEVSRLQRAFRHMCNGVEAFGKFVPRAVVQRVVMGDALAADLFVKKRVVTIMFSDLEGFTSLAESVSPRVLMQILEEYLTTVTDIIEAEGGTIGDFIGDGALCVAPCGGVVGVHRRGEHVLSRQARGRGAPRCEASGAGAQCGTLYANTNK